MDFISFSVDEFLMFSFFGSLILLVIAGFLFSEEKKIGFLPLIIWIAFIALMFLGNYNGQKQWKNKPVKYYEEHEIETVEYKDGSIVQYVYNHKNERINLTEKYDKYYPEGSTYREINKNGYSWFIFNYDYWIKKELNGKIYEIDSSLKLDK